jgi:DNA-binding transcriptional ArsR family regulator
VVFIKLTIKKINQMAITGIIIEKSIEELLNNGTRKKTFVLLEEGPFPSEILFELFNEKIALIENFKTGDRVWIKFRPKGFSKIIEEEGRISRWVSLRPYRITHYNSNLLINKTKEVQNNGN